MNPDYQHIQKERLKRGLVFASIIIAVIIIVILVLSSLPNNSSPKDTDIMANSPTPYGTETAQPFYTPTPEPDDYVEPTVEPTTEPSSNETPTPIDGISVTNTPSPIPTVVPDITPVPVNQNIVYRKGDESNDVLLIQKMLIAMGFDPGTADGKFGSSLEYAAEQYQMYAGLEVDGVIGPATIKEMINDYEEYLPKPMSNNPVLKGKVIGIDPGHQKYENQNKEPLSPGSSKMVYKAGDGTYGRWTDAKEYSINLQVALKLKVELEALGATVIMTRETNTKDISYASRAKLMNENDVDCWLQIYCNGSDDSSNKGMLLLLPKNGTMDTTDNSVYTKSNELGDLMLSKCVSAASAKKVGTMELSSLTAFNWSQRPVCLLEIGYLSNQIEDKLLVTKSYQKKIVNGMIDAFIEYFKNN